MDFNLPSPDIFNRPRNLLLISLLVFLVAFPIMTPKDELARWASYRVSEATGVQLQMESLGWAFPIGVSSEGSTIQLTAGGPSVLACEKVRLTPAWLKLLGLSPALSFSCQTNEGSLKGTLSTSGELQARLESLTTNIPLGTGSADRVQLTGLSGEVRAVRQGTAWRPQTADLTSSSLQLNSAWIPNNAPVRLNKIVLQGKGDNRSFQLSRLTSQGDLEVSGTGKITWRGNTMAGQWDSQLTLKPGENFPDSLRPLLQSGTRPQQDGRFLLRTRTPFRLN